MSSSSDSPLATGFAPVTEDQWAEAANKGSDPSRALTSEVEPGLESKWLYVPGDRLAPDPGGIPGQAPFTRGARAGQPWQIWQECRQPDRGRANAEILEDLNGGAGGVELCFDEAARTAATPGSDGFAAGRGAHGVAISTLDDLAAVLAGVYLDLAPVALDAGASALPAAALLAGLWRQNGVAPEAALGSLRVDPLGALAATGKLPRPPREALALAAAVAAEVDAAYPAAGADPALPPGEGAAAAGARPGVTVLSVDTGPYVSAGATATWELAIALATGVEYLRACATAGLSPARAATRIEFTLAIGPDQFLELAKFRAARRVWARVLETAGVPEAERRSPVFGRTSDRMLTSLDPWTNMLRGTTAAFAAGLGGADGVTVAAFDRDHADVAVAGGEAAAPNRLGRRISRNTQIILQEESSLGHLADPAAGSWYVESLTDELAQAAWRRFQEIEGQGGALDALTSGWIARQLATLADERQGELARRERLMTGVNIFPLLGGDGVEVESQNRAALARVEAERLAERPANGRLAELTVAAEQAIAAAGEADRPASAPGLFALAVSIAEGGARIDELAAALAGETYEQEPLPVRRDADDFERLRGAALGHEATAGERPAILLACLGPIARHVGAANWAKSFFEAGGIEARGSVEVAAAAAAAEGRANGAALEKGEAKVPAPGELGEVLRASGARIAAICAGRAQTSESIAEAISVLRDAGAEYVYLATPTDEQAKSNAEAADPKGRADEVVRDGVDMVAVLSAALARLGVDIDAAVQETVATRAQPGQPGAEGGPEA